MARTAPAPIPFQAARPGPPRPAAGLLLRVTDPDGTAWILLGKRHPDLGGTWSNIGGSLNRGEAPLAGAAREFTEELGLNVSDLRNPSVAAEVHLVARVPYTLFLVDVDHAFDNGRLSWEHTDAMWFPATDVPELRLHTGFAACWAQLAAAGHVPAL